MKKFIIASVLLLTLVFVPQSAAAQTSAELQALIASLQAQIMALTAQLEARQGTACMVPTGNAYFGDEDSYGSNNIINLQKFLIKKGYLSMPAGVGYGFFGNLTGVAVNSWHKAADIYERDGNGRAYLGPIGIEIIRASGLCSGTVTPPTGNQSPVITGLTAPTNLKVGETGTWLVKAYDPEGQPLSYNVDWGDVVKVAIDTFPTTNQTTSFTHRYNQAGTYIVNFSVADEKGGIARTSATIVVGDVVSGQGYPQATTTGATLALSVNDSYGNGVLKAVHNVNIRAMDGDVYVYNLGFNKALYLNGENSDKSDIRHTWQVEVVGPSNPSVECPKVGGQCYLIKAGTTRDFKVTYQWDTRLMFAGVYYNKVYQVLYVGGEKFLAAPVASSVTNKVTVVGEKSPYIESVTPTVSVGGTVTVKGPRLCGISGISMSGNTGYAQPMTCTSGAGFDSLTFVVNLKTPPGDYALQLLDNNRGNSNILHFEVTGGTIANPTITVISPNGGEIWTVGELRSIRWTTNASVNDKIRIRLVNADTTDENMIIDRGVANTGRYEWTVGNYNFTQTAPAGSRYKVAICVMKTDATEGVCDRSNAQFTIKASAAMVNRQVAIVLQSVQGVLNLLNRVVVN